MNIDFIPLIKTLVFIVLPLFCLAHYFGLLNNPLGLTVWYITAGALGWFADEIFPSKCKGQKDKN